MHYARSRRPAARIGVSISKRFVRRAVRRNRLRRIIRESFRQQWRSELPPMDVFISLTETPPDEKTARAMCAKLLASAVIKK